MKKHDIARNIVRPETSLQDVMKALNSGIYGIVLVAGENGTLLGIFTDGDVRRALLGGAQLDDLARIHMNTAFVSGSVKNSHEENVSILNETIRHLPILDATGCPVDLISWAEIWRLPVSAPDLGGNELKYVSDCITSGWISSQGHYVKQFEKLFSEFCVTDALTVSSGTTALHLALAALNIGPGDEVIVPDLTFAASANVVMHCGAKPVFVDVTEKTWTMDPYLLEEAITDKTRAVMPVHLYGHPCDMDPILEIARTHDLYVVEDCAEALGARYKSQLVGSLGDVGCFSFFANKVITTGEGGMVVTRDCELKEKMIALRDHGMSKERRYWHEFAGFNYRMTNLQAAVGVAQMENLENFLAKRKIIADRYKSNLSGIDGISLPPDADWAENIFWLYSIVCDPNILKVSVDELITKMEFEGVETRPFFSPMHIQPPYPKSERTFPISQRLAKNGISLPNGNDTTVEDVDRICRAVRSILENARIIETVRTKQ